MKQIVTILIMLFFLSPLCWRGIGADAFAQSLGGNPQKSIQYDRDFVFKDGVYVTLMDFKNNTPIPTSKIIFRSNRSDKDYLKLALANSTFKYIDSTDKEQEMKTDNLWGYCFNGTIYINHGTDFNRMVVIGSFCHFAATIADKIPNDPFGYGYGNGNFSYNPYPRYIYSTQQFILDFESGRVFEFNADNMEMLLQRDKTLHAEFVILKRKQKRDSVFLYLRKFNEKHPIYFPE